MDNLMFFKQLDNMKDEEYFKCFISYLISPVITGVKPSSIINILNTNRNLLNLWNAIGADFLSNLKLDYISIDHISTRETILIYNKNSIADVLSCPKVRSLLNNYGYTDLDDTNAVLNHLYNRLKENRFPHEAGIFLGIPIHDVEGFISCNKPCLLSGYWKVYSDTAYAKKLFDLYDQSKNLVAECIIQGENVISLKNNFAPQLLN
ncbi:DUF3793 family protein [Clostridium sp. C8-1-8]|uniref:DUF3793 family protein n=1 Tax=Clostridium sp. C8-1-8 TaxID=2698831 RepID=UPI0013713609|nr:DUF3793 family protein [Clostridium sp. C8-1-8]